MRKHDQGENIDSLTENGAGYKTTWHKMAQFLVEIQGVSVLVDWKITIRVEIYLYLRHFGLMLKAL